MAECTWCDAMSKELTKKEKVIHYLKKRWLFVLNISLFVFAYFIGATHPIPLILFIAWLLTLVILIVNRIIRRFKEKKRIRAIVLLVLSLTILAHQIYWIPSVAQTRLLWQMPIGSSREEALEFVDGRWEVQHEKRRIEEGNLRFILTPIEGAGATNAIIVYMGTRSNVMSAFFPMESMAFWAFDDDGYLVGLVVQWSLPF